MRVTLCKMIFIEHGALSEIAMISASSFNVVSKKLFIPDTFKMYIARFSQRG